METLDPAGEFLRISERYRQMSDSELLVLARQRSELTDVAQQALANEISQRRLKVEPESEAENEKPSPRSSAKPPAFVLVEPAQPHDSYGCDSSEDDSSGGQSIYDEERRLVLLRTAWSLPDALQLQTLLDRAGIPFFMGPEKATSVDRVTSNFADGVDVQIMRIGLPWAMQAMQNYTPGDEPAPKQEELSELPVRCPKCQSTDVIFERLVTKPAAAPDSFSPKYKWTCDFCGHHWEDDGTVEEE
jgi:DNA-directed RNA polymerase subunit M/transcription elongation factor TFIIS